MTCTCTCGKHLLIDITKPITFPINPAAGDTYLIPVHYEAGNAAVLPPIIRVEVIS
jgi:hypothetical protein